MKFPTKTRIGFTFASILALSACASDLSQQGSRITASADIEAMGAAVADDASLLRGAQATGRPSNVAVREGIYLGEDGFRVHRGDPLPRRFEADNGIVFNSPVEMNIRDFAFRLKSLTGMRVDYRDIAATPLFAGSESGGENAAGLLPAMGGADSTTVPSDLQGDPEGGSGASMAGGNPAGGSDHPVDITFRVNYEGPLSGLLDYVASQAGVDWEYRGGRIKFLGPQTATYTIWALPNSVTAESTIGSEAEGGGFGTAGNTTVTNSVENAYWEDLSEGLDAIIPSLGTAYAVNQSTGTITVTALRSTHERVADYVERENARLSRQVAVRIDVIAFQARDNSSRSTSLNGVLESVSDGIRATATTGPVTSIAGGVDFGTTILDNDSDLFGNLTGSQAALRALSQYGRVSVLNSTTVTAMNNISTPVNITRNQAYLAGTTVTTEDDGATSTEIDTDTITSGINILLTPRIMSGGEVNVNYTMTVTELENLATFNGGGNFVQLPEVSSRSFMQTVNMDSGDSMVIASYDNAQRRRESASPFSPAYWGLGGSDSFDAADTQIVIVMTPVVLEKQNAPTIRRR